LVLGILWLWWIGSILALIFGYVGRRHIARSNGTQGGGGLAIGGIVLGWVGMGTLAIVAGILIAGAVRSGGGGGSSSPPSTAPIIAKWPAPHPQTALTDVLYVLKDAGVQVCPEQSGTPESPQNSNRLLRYRITEATNHAFGDQFNQCVGNKGEIGVGYFGDPNATPMFTPNATAMLNNLKASHWLAAWRYGNNAVIAISSGTPPDVARWIAGVYDDTEEVTRAF
jgi:hypothetical protein